MTQIIQGEHIERAERILRGIYAIGIGDNVLLDRTRVDTEEFENYMRHHKETLFDAQNGYLKEVDPRHEAPIMTMMRHMFCVGAIAQRCAEGRS